MFTIGVGIGVFVVGYTDDVTLVGSIRLSLGTIESGILPAQEVRQNKAIISIEKRQRLRLV